MSVMRSSVIISFHVIYHNFLFQDAHEFLNFLINHINEIIIGEQGPKKGPVEPAHHTQSSPTWINQIFQVPVYWHNIYVQTKIKC